MSHLASEYRATLDAREPQTLEGFDRWCDTHIRRRQRGNVVNRLRQQATAIESLSADLLSATDAELTALIAASKQQARRGGWRGESANSPRGSLTERAFAQIGELAFRTLGKRPYQVQMMGALALHYGYASQMYTGEGKTLTASLAACFAAWNGRPCHVVTSNDYLAARDAELMAPLYEGCGLRVAAVVADMDDEQRRQAYLCDVVYATSKELLADYLRDQMRRNNINTPDRRLIKSLASGAPEAMVMRGLDTAIVDEADSVLVDDALTPLIISAPGENHLLKEASTAAHIIVNQLQEGVHYIVEPVFRDVRLTDAGELFVDEISDDLPPVWRGKDRRLNILRQALIAKEFYQRDRHYIIDDEEIIIVDEKTGRSMPGRSWSYGLHQAVEAKEGVPLSDPTETHVKLSFQRFFRRYRKLAGMSGTLQGLEHELWSIYRLRTVTIPPRRDNRRQRLPDRYFLQQTAKWQAIVELVQQVHSRAQPVLVGTRSILESEHLAALLREAGVSCQVLNAHHHAREAAIIARAGEAGMVTIATNMAGRGTDIHISDDVEALGGLYVIASERHESNRVDHQLFGRCARQGQPGVARAFVSLEDELFRTAKDSVLLAVARRIVRNQNTAVAHWAMALLVKLTQHYREKTFSSERLQMLQLEQSTEDMLSFVNAG